jgi:DNA-binding CsgD family transcriptional regulator
MVDIFSSIFFGVYMPIPREVLEKLYRYMSDEEIARRYGYTPRYVRKLRLTYGLYRRYRRKMRSRCSEIPREDIEKLYRSMSDNEIAKIYSVSVDCIKMLRRRYGLLRKIRKIRVCPEIPREELEKLIDKTDREIAMIYNTKPHCITQRRLKLGIKKYMAGGMRFIDRLADKIEDFLLRKIEIEGTCYTTSKEIKEKLRIRIFTDVWDELARRGYKIFKIWGRYLGLGFPRTFIYKPGCEELIATKILMEIMRQVEKRKKRRDIKEVRKAAVNIIRRHILPKEMEEALQSVLKDMAKLLKSPQSN